jgi:hypothetical protein
MDRSFLSKPQVVAASRDFVCVRLATYEDPTEASWLKDFTRTGSGQLENTVFGILAPDGVKKLVRSSRGVDHLYAGPDQFAEALKKIASKYPNTTAPSQLPLVASARLGVNIAAADNQPLVVVVGKDAANRKPLVSKLATLAWSDEFLGKFIYAAGSNDDLGVIEGMKVDAGILIVAPETFGRSGKMLATVAADASIEQIAEALRSVAGSFHRSDKTFSNHVRSGHQQGVFWETTVPVTDPMEQAARARGKKKS